ncbi:MAG: multidrug ABC transporter [Peptococcaceae bacterium BICA1-7]|nr:MAG: multidrug ABC transporter [Peptococcaceae bacterium BICA1-7]HBV95459.1 AcrB/AcrD/AcrF family protein [Desulfotomaculum sp.]
MKLAEFSVKRPVAISMLIVALILLGVVSLPKLRVDLYPDMNLPFVLVSAQYEGASPAEVENLVTKPMEGVLASANNVKDIISWSESGVSRIGIQLEWGVDMDQAALDIRDKIDIIRSYLPSDVKTPQVLKMDPNSMPIMSLTLSGSDLSEMKRVAEDVIQPKLERTEGVASAYATGGREAEIKVVLDQHKLQAFGLTSGQVSQAISSDNLSGTAGSVIKGASDLDIRVVGEYKKAKDLENVSISLPGGGAIRLGDLATIKDDYKKTTQISFVNGSPSVGIMIFKETGGNTVRVAEGIHETMDSIKAQLPEGMRLDVVYDGSVFIKQSIGNVVEHGILGGILAVIVLYLFLRSFRSTIIVAMVIPISIIGTFSMMYFGGQTINMLSLGGLALGVGSLVDFSVVVLESIYRYRQDGHGVIDSAIKGTSEVGNAVVASAATQVVVFMPIVFVQGLAGILFGPMALTVSFSHLAALFAALTLVPMITARMLRVTITDNENGEGVNGRGKIMTTLHLPAERFGKYYRRFADQYSVLLNWALGHRKTVVLSSLGLLVGSCIVLAVAVGTEFIPSMDQGQINVNVELPTGSQLSETGKIVSRVEEIASSEPATDIIFSSIGSGGEFAMLGGGSPEVATIQIKLKPLEERNISTDEMVEKLRNQINGIPGAKFTVDVADDSGGGGAGAPVSIRIAGDDLGVLEDLGGLVAEEVKAVEGTRNVTSSLEEARPEMQVLIDRQRAAQYGVTVGQVLSAARTAFDGQVVSRVRTGEDEIDIRLMYPDNYRLDINNVANTMIISATGARLALGDVARVELNHAPVSITRFNQARLVTVDSEFVGRDLGSVNRDITARLDAIKLPPGYTLDIGGQAQDMADSFGDMGLAILLAIVLVYMVMAAQFESLFYPFVIMFSIPPTIVGVTLGLLITGYNLSVPALIGYIMLIGIVVNNAIVLIDYVNTLRKRGLNRDEAIRRAGPVRLRPIMMTTLATVLALIPLAFGSGEGSEGQAPLAVVVSFGLTLSTIITLVLIPVMYTILDDVGRAIVKRTSLWFSSGSGVAK